MILYSNPRTFVECSIAYVSAVSTETVILELNSDMQDNYSELQRTERKEVAVDFLQIL